MFKKVAAAALIFPAIVAFAQDEVMEQVPSDPPPAIEPASALPGETGRAIITTETAHRKSMGTLARELESETIKLSIATTKAQRAKALAELNATATGAAEGSANGPVVSPSGSRVAAMPPPIIGFAGGTSADAQIPAPPAPAAPAATLPPPPKAVAKVGETVVFTTDAGRMTARIGESVSGYVVKQIEGRRVTLDSLALPTSTLVLQIP